MHSVLQPAGPPAHLVTALWWWMFGAATIVYLIVLAALFGAVIRSRRQQHEAGAPVGLGAANRSNPSLRSGRQVPAARWVAMTAATTMCIVGVFLAYSV